MKSILIENQEFSLIMPKMELFIPFPRLTWSNSANRVNRIKATFYIEPPEHTAAITLGEFQALSSPEVLTPPKFIGFTPPHLGIDEGPLNRTQFVELTEKGFKTGATSKVPVFDQDGGTIREAMYYLDFPMFYFHMDPPHTQFYRTRDKLQSCYLLRSLELETFWEDE